MPSTSVAQKIISSTEIFVLYVSIIFLISGLIGNCLNIILFTTLRSLRNKPCGYYFHIESIVNLGQIFIGLISYILQYGFDINAITNSMVWCKIKTAGIQSLHLIFLSTICFAAFDQFLSTHYLYSVRQMSTKTLARNLILGSIILMIVHMIVSLMFFELRSQILGCVIYNSIIAKYFIFFFYPVLIGLLPIMVTVIFSLLAFYNVRHLVRRQVPIERRQLDHQLTAMMFARVIAYVGFGLPYIIFRIYSVNKPIASDNAFKFAINFMIGSITGSWGYVNYIISFYVFFLSSSRFRRQVKHMLVKKYSRLTKRLQRRITPKANENQVSPEPSLPKVSTIRLN